MIPIGWRDRAYRPSRETRAFLSRHRRARTRGSLLTGSARRGCRPVVLKITCERANVTRLPNLRFPVVAVLVATGTRRGSGPNCSRHGVNSPSAGRHDQGAARSHAEVTVCHCVPPVLSSYLHSSACRDRCDQHLLVLARDRRVLEGRPRREPDVGGGAGVLAGSSRRLISGCSRAAAGQVYQANV